MLRRGKPGAGGLPDFRPRLATAAYMVFAAANMAPNVRNAAMIYPMNLMAMDADIWSSKYRVSRMAVS